jgi:hypothetical protein
MSQFQDRRKGGNPGGASCPLPDQLKGNGFYSDVFSYSYPAENKGIGGYLNPVARLRLFLMLHAFRAGTNLFAIFWIINF